jgi:DNA-binding MarR family transcriptional regulator
MPEDVSLVQNYFLGNYFGGDVTEHDSIDGHVARWVEELPYLDATHEAIVARLMIVSRYLSRSREAAHAADDLARPSFKILLALRRVGRPYTANPSQLAASLGLSRGALSVRLAPLEKAGYIVRTVDPDDRRRVDVRLTAKGRAAFDRHARHEGRDEATLLSVLSKPDQRRLADLLRTLVLAIEQHAT